MNSSYIELNGIYILKGPSKLTPLSGDLKVFDVEVSEPVVVPVGRSVPITASGARVQISPNPDVLKRGDPELYERLRLVAKEVSELEPPVLLLGPTDVGKSTIAFWSASLAGLRGERTWILSTDVGQNEIFMPAFESLVEVKPPLVPGKARGEEVYSCFVGSFTPSRALSRYLRCFVRLIRKVRGWAVIDTDGWVDIGDGVESKVFLAESLEGKGSVVVIGDEELGGILKRYGIRARIVPGIIKSRKTVEERRRNRIRMLSSELSLASEKAFDLSKMELVGFPIFNCDRAEDLESLSPRILYAERCRGRTFVVVRGTVRLAFKAKFIKDGWERGLLVALSSDELKERPGVILKISYKSNKVSVLTREREAKRIVAGFERVEV